jgi:hypothetical protein
MTDEHDPISQRLESSRPVPRPGFRGDLRRALLAEAGAEPAPPPRLRLLIATYAGSGLVLLAIVGVGIAGIGPFAS